MSISSSQQTFDHPDWAEPQAGGQQTVFAQNNIVIAAGGQANVGPVDVRAFAQILVYVVLETGGGNGTYDFSFSNTPGGANTTTYEPIWYTQGSGNVLTAVAPLGPFLTITIGLSAGVSGTFSVVVIGLPTAVAQEVLVPPQLLITSNQSLAANATANVNYGLQISGPAMLFGLGTAGNWRTEVEAWDGTTWQHIAAVSGALGLGDCRKITLPQNDCRLVLVNLAGVVSTVVGAITRGT